MLVRYSEDERIAEAALRRAFASIGPAAGPEAIAARLRELGVAGADGDAGSLRLARVVAVEAGRACLAYPVVEQLALALLAGRSEALLGSLRHLGGERAFAASGGESQHPDAALEAGALRGESPLIGFPAWPRAIVMPVLRDARVALALVPVCGTAVRLRRKRSVEAGWPVATLAFDGLALEAQDIVSTLDDGTDACRAWQLVTALLAAAEICGAAEAALELTGEYLGTRRQFGRPLSANQVLRHAMADNRVRLTAMRSAVDYGTLALDAAAEDAEVAVRSAKHYASVEGKALAEDMLQLTGAMGFTMEYGLGRLIYRILRVAAMYGAPRFQEERLFALLSDSAAEA